jgi:AcrR family transcriptional regulator
MSTVRQEERTEESRSAECGPKSANPGGRPRSEASRVALLETAYGLMVDHPLSSISTQQIASKAGVSTATVYRWWATKEALLLDAFLHVKEQRPPTGQEGKPLDRLREHVMGFGKSTVGKQGRVVARLLAAIQEDEKLREAFIQRLYLPQCGRVRTVAQEAVNAGELPPGTDVDLFLDSILGTILTRLLLRHEAIQAADVEKIFDFAVAGAWGFWSADRSKDRS